MSAPRLVGINGLKGSGKDTTCKLLAEIVAPRNEAVVRRAFADNMKLLAARCLGLLGDEAGAADDVETAVELCDLLKLDGPTVETVFRGKGVPLSVEVTGREFLQYLGAEVRNVLGDTLWIDAVVPLGQNDEVAWPKWCDKFVVDHLVADWCCVTDVRYPNEAERILGLGGEVWEITRPGCESDGHATEQPLPRDLVTLTIHNDSDLDNLRAAVQQVAQGYGHRDVLPHP